MPGVTFLEGGHVTLRTIKREDAPLLQQAYNEPDFQQGFLTETPKNQQMVEDRFEETIEGDEDNHFLLICIDEDVVGGISLRDMR